MSAYTVPPRPTVTRYSRQDVLRILRVHPRQLTAWERAGLILSKEQPLDELAQPYSFEDLAQMRTLLENAYLRSELEATRDISNLRERVTRLEVERGAARQ